MLYSKKTPDLLSEAIENVFLEMKGEDVNSDAYAAMTTQLTKLYALKSPSINPDTVAIGVANIIAVLLIVSHERTHIIASKAIGLLFRTR
jgi:hypothetical protein